jgi:hypothetical protein
MGFAEKFKKKPTTAGTVAATGGAAAVGVAVLNASQFLDPALVAELTEKIATGGLTVNSIVTAVLVWFIARNRKLAHDLQTKLDKLLADADTPPDTDTKKADTSSDG